MTQAQLQSIACCLCFHKRFCRDGTSGGIVRSNSKVGVWQKFHCFFFCKRPTWTARTAAGRRTSEATAAGGLDTVFRFQWKVLEVLRAYQAWEHRLRTLAGLLETEGSVKPERLDSSSSTLRAVCAARVSPSARPSGSARGFEALPRCLL